MKNFIDNKELVCVGVWEINVSLFNLKTVLENWKKCYGLNLKPDFTNNIVWSEYEQIKYMESFLSGLKNSNVIYFNSPAFSFNPSVSQIDLLDEVVCVDGFEKLNAALRFINTEIDVSIINSKNLLNNCNSLPNSNFSLFNGTYIELPEFKFNVNCLKNRNELLNYYFQFNNKKINYVK